MQLTVPKCSVPGLSTQVVLPGMCEAAAQRDEKNREFCRWLNCVCGALRARSRFAFEPPVYSHSGSWLSKSRSIPPESSGTARAQLHVITLPRWRRRRQRRRLIDCKWASHPPPPSVPKPNRNRSTTICPRDDDGLMACDDGVLVGT